MNKKLVLFVAGFVLTTGFVSAQEVATEVAAPAVAEVSAVVEVGNTICPLTARTLNLNDTNDFARLEVEGFAFNVCPKGKVEYNKDAAQFADKLAQAVNSARSSIKVEVPKVEEVATTPLPTEVKVDAAVPVIPSPDKPVDEAVPVVTNAEVSK